MADRTCRILTRAVEVSVFVPVGLLVTLGDHVRSRRRRAGERIVVARWIGERAVGVGVQAVTSRGTQALVTPLAPVAPVSAVEPGARVARVAPVAPVVPVSAVAPPVAPPGRDAGGPGAVGSVRSAAPFEGYDALAAAHIVGRLPRLDRAELASVRLYEVGHRNRRTVVAMADQLLDG